MPPPGKRTAAPDGGRYGGGDQRDSGSRTSVPQPASRPHGNDGRCPSCERRDAAILAVLERNARVLMAGAHPGETDGLEPLGQMAFVVDGVDLVAHIYMRGVL